jgi:hypothetical protein
MSLYRRVPFPDTRNTDEIYPDTGREPTARPACGSDARALRMVSGALALEFEN